MKRLIIFCVILIGTGLSPWLVSDAPSLQVSGWMMVLVSLGWCTMWALDMATAKREKGTEESPKTCYQVQASAGRRLLPEFYDGEGEWSLGDENGRISHTLPDARHASNEALTCLPEAADDAIVRFIDLSFCDH